MQKYIYNFKEANGKMVESLGAKGASLAEMTKEGLNVPKGFIISTEACQSYLAGSQQGLSPAIDAELEKYIKGLEKRTGKSFNDPNHLLLVSIRSGAAYHLPENRESILNVGLNDKNVEHLARSTKNRRFAYDCYRRLLQMYGQSIYGIDRECFQSKLDAAKAEEGVERTQDLSYNRLRLLVNQFKAVYTEELGISFPQVVTTQIADAIKAIYKNWDSDYMREQRSLHDLPEDLGTAVIIQEMVFGNAGEESGTGIIVVHQDQDEKELEGEFLLRGQGEDVVIGSGEPMSLSQMKDYFPENYDYLVEAVATMKTFYKKLENLEFTIEDGQSFILEAHGR